jgi:hypothetical protein
VKYEKLKMPKTCLIGEKERKKMVMTQGDLETKSDDGEQVER